MSVAEPKLKIVPYETFAASDGEFVLAVGNDELWRTFCRVAGLDALATDARFATNRVRVRNYDALKPLLVERLRRRTRRAWIDALTADGVPCGAVRDVSEVLQDPQLEVRSMIQAVEHAALGTVRVLGVPVKLSDTPGAVRAAPPTLGQHTDAILREIGITAPEADALRADGIV